MSEIAIGAIGASDNSTFKRATMLLLVAVGTLAFLAMLVLGAYAPDLRSGRNGGTHALSKSATGFAGLVRLAQATGRNPVIVRSEAHLRSEDLVVISPDHGSTDLTEILERRGPRATLIVLPKWDTTRDPEKPGWVRVPGLLPVDDPGRMLAPATPLTIARSRTKGEPLRTVHEAAPQEVAFLAPRVTQTMGGSGLKPIITDRNGRIIVAQVNGRPLYLLAEPDLLNNHGMGDVRQARAALALLDFLNSTGATSILFDVTSNGLGHSRSPLRLAFDPPFLGVTLTIFAAMLLAGWQALVRFGSPRRPERAIAFGKAALVDNSAALIRKAGREASLGSRYVDVIRHRAAALFRLAPTLSSEALDQRLDSLNNRRSFSELAAAASNARNRDELLGAARSLNHWIEEVLE